MLTLQLGKSGIHEKEITVISLLGKTNSFLVVVHVLPPAEHALPKDSSTINLASVAQRLIQ